MTDAVLELVCPSCDVWLVRYEFPLDQPLDETSFNELVPVVNTWIAGGREQRTMRFNAPGSFHLSSADSGDLPSWERWLPGNAAADLADPDPDRGYLQNLDGSWQYHRTYFVCPNADCPQSRRYRTVNLEAVVFTALKWLHDKRDTREPYLRTTADRLLSSAR